MVIRMSLTPQEYNEMAKKASPSTNSLRNFICAFLIGGAICCLGELLLNSYTALGMSAQDAGAVTSVTLIFLSALFTGLNLYDKLAKFGGAGTLVPITGFANAVVSPALEYKCEGYIMGIGVKLFSIAGPVIVYGCAASVLYGVILFLFT